LTRITAERERVNAELQMATRIQNAMLPNRFPAFPDRPEFDLYACMTPAKEVGGDFYDFFLVDDDHLALVIADVSDKGVPAALFMMSAKIIINYRAHMGGTPSEILTAANAQLLVNNESKMFVTVWLGILELSTGRLCCANAGHEYPILRGQDGTYRIFKDMHGMMVGAMKIAKYHDYELQLAPGDAVFVYTDGAPEANNAAGEFYGMDRLEAALNRIGDAGPREILEGVRDDIAAFSDGANQFDDLTMLCVVYKGKEKT
jgi:sigma-B regulation protein RsbU (phosphoserine phosphatase)